MAKGTLFLTAMAIVLVLAHAEIKLQSVERKINLNSQFARITEIIKAKNTGSKAEDRVTLCQLQQGKSVIAYQKVSQQLSSKIKLKFSPTTIKDAPDQAVCWSVQLKEPIPAGEVATLDSLVVLANAQTAYPAEVAQGEPQLMLFNDNVHVISPYHISTQTTEVILPSSTVKSYTDTEKPVSKNENRIKYGKYDLIKPWSISPLRLHFDNPKPFRKVLSLTREIEVSHWGNIYVEEQYELKNDGAKHKGAFSRLRHAHSYGGQGNSFQELKARVPSSAHSLYYVDIIGNISTSAVRKTNTETVIDFMTRYPLLGGWKVDFKLGYSVPLKGFLSAIKGGKRRLSIDFSSPVDGVYIEDLTVKIVLPEGSSAIAASLPYEVEQWADVKFTYLDVTGRPVVVLHKKHLVPEHSAKVTVDYSFATFEILREPLMLITAFAALFAAAIVYNRLELTIARDDKWQAAQDIEKLTTIMQAINTIVDEQDEVLESLSKLTASVTSPDAVDDAIKEKNNQEATFTNLENKAKSLSSTVMSMQPKVGEKVKDVIDKARSTQQRLVKIFNDRCDLIRKGTSISEVVKRVPSGAEARQELATVVETLFAPY